MKLLQQVVNVGTIGVLMVVVGLAFANDGLTIGGSVVFSSGVIAAAILATVKK